MEFELVLRKLLEGFEERGIRYAAIGGYAFRPLGLRIVKDAVETRIFDKKIKTARPEDIIGLKLQALCNSEPGSRDQDNVDIKSF